jgi:hypothetical protein
MGKTQYTYLERKKAESGQTGTATYDLPERGFLPEILLTIYSTPTASTTPATPISDAITKIEVIDGGTVLKSITGNQAKALSMIHKYPRLASTEKNDNAVEGYDQIFLPLGGFFNGQEYAPDMSVFNNPQIKLTWDYSLTTTEFGMTGAADSSPAMKFTVLAKILREPGVFNHGYVKSTILKEFTQAASTTTVVELPRGQPLIGFGVEAGYSAKDFVNDLAEIKLDFDNGDWIPFHLYAEEVNSIQQLWFNHPFMYTFYSDLEDADELDTHMGWLGCIHATPGIDSSKGLAFRFDENRRGVETVDLMDLATPTATDVIQQIGLTSIGWEPFHMWYCPVRAILGDEHDTIDTAQFSRIELELTSDSSASTSSTPDVVADYLVM